MALLESAGKITFLRVHDEGTGFGPPYDFIDVEVVVKIDSHPDNAYGFQLRNDGNRPARAGMLSLLRDAFNQDRRVLLDYDIDQGKNNGVIIRVALTN
jgi:hypothetical protein